MKSKRRENELDEFLSEQGLLKEIDENKMYHTVLSTSKKKNISGSKHIIRTIVISTVLFLLVGFTSYPYINEIIDNYFGRNFSSLLINKGENSLKKKNVTITLLQSFTDNSIYYNIISIEGSKQSVRIEPGSIPGVSMIKEITSKDEDDKQYFVLTSFTKLSELTIKELQTSPEIVSEKINLSTLHNLETNEYEDISRSSILSSTGIEQNIEELSILKDEGNQTHPLSNNEIDIIGFGSKQNQFHFQIQSKHQSLENISVSLNVENNSSKEPSDEYMFEKYHSNNREYAKEFIFPVEDQKDIKEINIYGELYTDIISGDWSFKLDSFDELPKKEFINKDKTVLITVSPISVSIDTSTDVKLKGESVIGQDLEGNRKELAELDEDKYYMSQDYSYLIYYSDINNLKKIYVGNEEFQLKAKD
jgi:hypothetical protein